MRNFFGTFSRELDRRRLRRREPRRRDIGRAHRARDVHREQHRRLLAPHRHRRVRARDADDHHRERDEQQRDRNVAPPPGARSTRFGTSAGFAHAAAARCRRRSRQSTRRRAAAGAAARAAQCGELKLTRPLRRKSASSRSQSPDVDSTTWRTPIDASDLRRRARSAAAASANRRAQLRAARVDAELASGLRDRRATARPRSAAPARADRGSRSRSRRGGRRAGAAAGASRSGRGSRRRRRRASAGARARPCGGSPRRERSRRPASRRAAPSSRSAAEEPDQPAPSLAHGRPSADSRRRTSRRRGGCRAASRRARSRSRLPPRRRPCAARPSRTHRRRRVEDEPRDEHALRLLHANVRLARARGHVPVDLPNVVAEHVRTDLRELAALPEQPRAVVAGEQALPSAAPTVMSSARSSRSEIGPGPGLSGVRSVRSELHAALVRAARSTCGNGTCSMTRSRIVSALTSSASAWYESTSRWRIASFASARRSSTTT